METGPKLCILDHLFSILIKFRMIFTYLFIYLFIYKLFHYKYVNFCELEYFCSNVETFQQKTEQCNRVTSSPNDQKNFFLSACYLAVWLFKRIQNGFDIKGLRKKGLIDSG